MARENDNDNESTRQYGCGNIQVEGNLAADIKNISKNSDRPIVAAAMYANTTKYNGYEGSQKFKVIISGPRAKAILEHEEEFSKGAPVQATGELIIGEEYDGIPQLEITGWNATLNPNYKWADSGKSGGRKRRKDEDEDDDRGSSRSGRRSGRKDEDEDDDRGSSRSGRRGRSSNDDEDDNEDRGSNRRERRSRVRDNGDD